MACAQIVVVERVPYDSLSIDDFREKYFVPGLPVIIEGAPTCKLPWTLENLQARVGENVVYVRRNTNTYDYHQGRAYAIEQMKFASYVDNLLAGGRKAHSSYMAVQNVKKAFPQLSEEIVIPHFIGKMHCGPYLWMAPPGHYEYCHVDPDDNFLAMVSGQKVIKMFGTADFNRLYPNHLGLHGKTVQSQVDVLNPDLERFPDFAQATCYEARLDAGDMLFIPSFFWHQVTSPQQCISLNFFFGDAGENNYMAKVLKLPRLSAFAHWLLNIVEQNRPYEAYFTSMLTHLPESLRRFFEGQYHEVLSPSQMGFVCQLIHTYLRETAVAAPPVTDQLSEDNSGANHAGPAISLPPEATTGGDEDELLSALALDEASTTTTAEDVKLGTRARRKLRKKAEAEARAAASGVGATAGATGAGARPQTQDPATAEQTRDRVEGVESDDDTGSTVSGGAHQRRAPEMKIRGLMCRKPVTVAVVRLPPRPLVEWDESRDYSAALLGPAGSL